MGYIAVNLYDTNDVTYDIIIETLTMLTMLKRKFAGKDSYDFKHVRLFTIGFSFTIRMIFLELEIGTERVATLKMY